MNFKKITFLLILISSLTCLGQSNSGEIIYGARMISSPIDISKASSLDQKNMMEQDIRILEKELKKIKFILNFNDDKSIFYAEEIMMNDANPNRELAISFTTEGATIYTDLQKKETINEVDVYGRKYLVEKPHELFNWSISNKTKSISGYTCYKATTKLRFHKEEEKEIVAWFCPSLPFSFGPNGYAGLPGLIFELNDNGIYYFIKEINLSKREEINLPKKGKRLLYKNYLKEIDSIMKNTY